MLSLGNCTKYKHRMTDNPDDHPAPPSSPEEDGALRDSTTTNAVSENDDDSNGPRTTIPGALASARPSNARPALSPSDRRPVPRHQPAGRKGHTAATDSCVSAYLLTFLLLSGLNWRPAIEPLSKPASKDIFYEETLLLSSFGFLPQSQSKGNIFTSSSQSAKMDPSSGQEQDFFDPMVGRFRINPTAQLESFFKSKLRYYINLSPMAGLGCLQKGQLYALITSKLKVKHPNLLNCRVGMRYNALQPPAFALLHSRMPTLSRILVDVL